MKITILVATFFVFISQPALSGAKDCLEVFETIRSISPADGPLSSQLRRKRLAKTLHEKKGRLTSEEIEIVMDLAKQHRYPALSSIGVQGLTLKDEVNRNQIDYEEDVQLVLESIKRNPKDSMLHRLASYHLITAIARVQDILIETDFSRQSMDEISDEVKTILELEFDASVDNNIDSTPVPYHSLVQPLSSVFRNLNVNKKIRLAAIRLLFEMAVFAISPDVSYEQKETYLDTYINMAHHEWGLSKDLAQLRELINNGHPDEKTFIEYYRMFFKNIGNSFYLDDMLNYNMLNLYIEFIDYAHDISERSTVLFPNNYWMVVLGSAAVKEIETFLTQVTDPETLEEILSRLEAPDFLAQLDGTPYPSFEDVEEIIKHLEDVRNDRLLQKLDQFLSLMDSENTVISDRAEMYIRSFVYHMQKGLEISDHFGFTEELEKFDELIAQGTQIKSHPFFEDSGGKEYVKLNTAAQEIRAQAKKDGNQKLTKKFDQLLGQLESKDAIIENIAGIHLSALIYHLENDIEIPDHFYEYSILD